MSISNRQKRLREAFGDRENFCFYAYLLFAKSFDNVDEAKAIVAERNLEPDGEGWFEFPDVTFGNHSFSTGKGWIRDDNASILVINTYPLFCISPYKIKDDDAEFGTPADDLGLIAGQYVESIERQSSTLQFDRSHYCEDSDCAIDFKYALGSYNPSLCHPSELEKLRTITLPNGKIIRPSNSRLSLSNLEANRHNSYDWYWKRPKTSLVL